MVAITQKSKSKLIAMAATGAVAVSCLAGGITYAAWQQGLQVEQSVRAGQAAMQYSFGNSGEWHDFTGEPIILPAEAYVLGHSESVFGTFTNFVSGTERPYSIQFRNTSAGNVRAAVLSIETEGEIFEGDEPLQVNKTSSFEAGDGIVRYGQESLDFSLKAPADWDESYAGTEGVIKIDAEFVAIDTEPVQG